MYNEGGDPGTCGLHRRRAFWTFFITALGLGVVFLDISIVNVALQSISGGFNIGVTDLEWIVDAYTLAFFPDNAIWLLMGFSRRFIAGGGAFRGGGGADVLLRAFRSPDRN